MGIRMENLSNTDFSDIVDTKATRVAETTPDDLLRNDFMVGNQGNVTHMLRVWHTRVDR